MQTKHWYQSKTVWAGIVGSLVSGLKILEAYLLGDISGMEFLEQTIMFAASVYAIYGRVVAKTEIEK